MAPVHCFLSITMRSVPSSAHTCAETQKICATHHFGENDYSRLFFTFSIETSTQGYLGDDVMVMTYEPLEELVVVSLRRFRFDVRRLLVAEEE